MTEAGEALRERVGRWKYVLLVGAVGLGLLLWPSGGSRPAGPEAEVTEEARLEKLLSAMEGVGRSEVLLSESGAAVVCQGADSVSVRLDITEALRCYTGLGADKIVIIKMNESWREES